MIPQLLASRNLALDFQYCCVQGIPRVLVTSTACNLMNIKMKHLTKEASILLFILAVNITLSLHSFIDWLFDQILKRLRDNTLGRGWEEEQLLFVGLLVLNPVISQGTESQLWKCLLLISHVLLMYPVHSDQLSHSTFQDAFLSYVELH